MFRTPPKARPEPKLESYPYDDRINKLRDIIEIPDSSIKIRKLKQFIIDEKAILERLETGQDHSQALRSAKEQLTRLNSEILPSQVNGQPDFSRLPEPDHTVFTTPSRF